MRRSLTQLIIDDLAGLAQLETDIIASEEAIRFLIAMFKDKKALKNIEFVHKDQFFSYLQKRVMEDSSFLTKAGHYQFFIEVGARSKAKQRDPATIHYCALDLFIRPGLPPLAFVADHYRLSSGYYMEFQTISEKLGIQFVVAGDEYYQTDSVHCPVFTLMHLLLTAKDEKLLTLLEKKVGHRKTVDVVNLPWDNLPPEYVMYPQSLTTILNFVDRIKGREGLEKHMPSPILSSFGYEEKVTGFLFPVKSNKAELNNKIRSKGIKYLAAEYAGLAVLELEQTPALYTDKMLVALCYKERYPAVYKILCKALAIEEAVPFTDKYGPQAHPIFELAFAHATVLEICLKNSEFKRIFTNESILLLMQKGFLDPFNLFKKLTTIASSIELNQQTINQLANNLQACSILAEVVGSQRTVDKELLLGLMFSSKTKSFFQNGLLVDLFKKGEISLAMIDKILPYKINKKEFSALNDNEKMEYLTKLFSLEEAPGNLLEDANFAVSTPIPVKNALVSNGLKTALDIFDMPHDESAPEVEELFLIPESSAVTVVTTEATQKPGINVGLLVQSMTKGGILNTVKPSEQPKNSAEEVKVTL
ncbi:hypothetical protein [Legionella clemsonensis]|uniref:Uncharacterized protein n=1 Tax=Legionella clemsonensis TaxID=1867846 RepID=A0A222P3P5_9GAMM|nr:hypothetical protein [Legionella clemsonensis]ASQ46474.1 hypothetical protein clem_09620 [Legionella clemsonensis]